MLVSRPLPDHALEAVYGAPGAAGVWLKTAEGWLFGVQGELFALDGPKIRAFESMLRSADRLPAQLASATVSE